MLALAFHPLRLAQHACGSARVRGMPQTRAMAACSDRQAQDIAKHAKNIAVLGIKPESRSGQPAHYVPAYLAANGKNVIPIPTYYPEVTNILGKPVLRSVSEVQEPIDILDVFRKPSDLMQHVEDILSAPNRPKCVWLQSGITHQDFEARMAAEGIQVVSDKCLLVEHMNGA